MERNSKAFPCPSRRAFQLVKSKHTFDVSPAKQGVPLSRPIFELHEKRPFTCGDSQTAGFSGQKRKKDTIQNHSEKLFFREIPQKPCNLGKTAGKRPFFVQGNFWRSIVELG